MSSSPETPSKSKEVDQERINQEEEEEEEEQPRTGSLKSKEVEEDDVCKTPTDCGSSGEKLCPPAPKKVRRRKMAATTLVGYKRRRLSDEVDVITVTPEEIQTLFKPRDGEDSTRSSKRRKKRTSTQDS